MDTLSSHAGNSIRTVWHPSCKGSVLKGKNLLLVGANSFLLEQTSFQEGPSLQESKMKNCKKCLPCINVGKFTSISRTLNSFDPKFLKLILPSLHFDTSIAA